MSNLVTESMETVGRAADDLDNLLSAMLLPIPPQHHIEALRASLPRIRDALRDVFATETGFNPWE